MNKIKLSVALLVLTMMGCSDSDMDYSIDSLRTSYLQDERILPFFVFADNGRRLIIENDTLVEKNMNRKELILCEKETLADLKKEYKNKFFSDSAYYWNLERPADYICDESLLAINADYDVILSSWGDTLLTDESLYKSCKSLDESQMFLQKTTQTNDDYPPEVTVKAGGYELYSGVFIEKGKKEDVGGNSITPFWGNAKAFAYKQLDPPLNIGGFKIRRVGYRADAVYMYVTCGRGCRDVGNDVKCQKQDTKRRSWTDPNEPIVGKDDDTLISLTCNTVMNKKTKCYNACKTAQPIRKVLNGQEYYDIQCFGGMVDCTIDDYGDVEDFGVVSNATAIFNGGNVVLEAKASTNLSENVAAKIYKKYIYDVYLNH